MIRVKSKVSAAQEFLEMLEGEEDGQALFLALRIVLFR